MKHLLNGILLGIFLAAIFYLAGAFNNASFNLVDWSHASRYGIAIMGTLCSVIIMAVGVYLSYEYDKIKKK